MTALEAAIDAHERAKRAQADVRGIGSGCFGIAACVVSILREMDVLVEVTGENVADQRRMAEEERE